MTYENIRLIVNKYRRKLTANIRKKQLKNTEFTIISNNCWGGMIYESYNLPKGSPTVGTFFMASDYVKFVSDLRGYLSAELKFINPLASIHSEVLKNYARYGEFPIGKLKDIEIMFLHYHSEAEAKEKWERRCKRINWNRILIKMNDQNECTEDDIRKFLDLPYKHKLFFTCHEWENIPCQEELIVIKQPKPNDCIRASYEPFGRSRYVNITKIINSLD